MQIRISRAAAIGAAAILLLMGAAGAQAQPTGTFFVKNDRAGVGIDNPDARLDVRCNSCGVLDLMRLEKNGPARMKFIDSALGVNWLFATNAAGDFVINELADPVPAEMKLKKDGGLIVNGANMNVPDYVFADDYRLMPLAELERFIQEHRHLPNVANAEEIEREGGINLTTMPLQILEKVEELTLYVLALNRENEALEGRVAELEARLGGSD